MVQLKVTPSDSRIKLLAFQYLMVQLKDLSTGTKVKDLSFQYLMVQLKVRQYAAELSRMYKFQYLMVQLKDCCYSSSFLWFLYFNTSWYN